MPAFSPFILGRYLSAQANGAMSASRNLRRNRVRAPFVMLHVTDRSMQERVRLRLAPSDDDGGHGGRVRSSLGSALPGCQRRFHHEISTTRCLPFSVQ